MKASVSVLGVVLLTLAATRAGEDKKAADPKEQSVVAHDSKTHGAVQVRSASERPSDSFQVLQNGKSVTDGNPTLLDGKLEVAPGTYVVEVNRTRRTVTVEAGKMTVLWTGDLMVESQRKGKYWLPKQGKETRLASNPPIVNARVALFPGTYAVYVQAEAGAPVDLKGLVTAYVKAGKKTVVKE